jgi:glutamine cyclotransferase
MPFGRRRNKIELMKHKLIPYLTIALLAAIGCGEKNQSVNLSLSPDAGTNYKQGEKVNIKVSYPAGYKADSVVYLLDSARIASRKDSSAVNFMTDTLALGTKVITVKVYSGGKENEVSTNINLLAAKAPEEYTFQVEKTFPHDTASYTEGLEYHDGILYESDGGRASQEEGRSSLRKTDVNGKILQKIDIDPEIFAEGITLTGNKIIQLTYTEKVGFVYDKASLKLLSKFSYTAGKEGWGLCNDGKKIYNTDGTNRIFLLDINDYHQTGYIDVFDDKGPVNNLNELELIDGLLYANIYQTDNIVAIDPKTGAVVRIINLTTLYPKDSRPAYADVLNGIAWDAAGKRLFITGKKWPHLYQIKIMKDVPPVLTKAIKVP